MLKLFKILGDFSLTDKLNFYGFNFFIDSLYSIVKSKNNNLFKLFKLNVFKKMF